MNIRFLKYFYYSIFDIFKIFHNFYFKNNFVVIYPRIFGIILNNVKIYDKAKKKIFNYKARNYSDILTIYEIFSEESYNLKNYLIFKNIQNFYQKILENRKIPLIIDCGSNIGASSIYFSKLFNKSKIALVEPDHDSYLFSKKNVKGDNFFFFNNAVSNRNEKVRFASDKIDNRASKICSSSKEEVNCLTIDSILKKMSENDHINFLIKIDIEGYENKLFEDNFDWLDSFKVVIIEIHDWMLPNKSNSLNFMNALVSTSKNKRKRDLIISGENLISIRIDEK